MPTEKKHIPTSTLEFLNIKIEQFLAQNPHIPAPTFGKVSAGDTNLVRRLRDGCDVSTRKLDAILRYMSDPNKKENHYDQSSKGKETEETRQGSDRETGKVQQAKSVKARTESKGKARTEDRAQ